MTRTTNGRAQGVVGYKALTPGASFAVLDSTLLAPVVTSGFFVVRSISMIVPATSGVVKIGTGKTTTFTNTIFEFDTDLTLTGLNLILPRYSSGEDYHLLADVDGTGSSTLTVAYEKGQLSDPEFERSFYGYGTKTAAGSAVYQALGPGITTDTYRVEQCVLDRGAASECVLGYGLTTDWAGSFVPLVSHTDAATGHYKDLDLAIAPAANRSLGIRVNGTGVGQALVTGQIEK